jgi:hypothetical protein
MGPAPKIVDGPIHHSSTVTPPPSPALESEMVMFVEIPTLKGPEGARPGLEYRLVAFAPVKVMTGGIGFSLVDMFCST